MTYTNAYCVNKIKLNYRKNEKDTNVNILVNSIVYLNS